MAHPIPTLESLANCTPAPGTDSGSPRTVTTSDGVRLAVRDYGRAETSDHTVVLMHGLLLTQDAWDIQVRHLLRRWGSSVRVITYDHRGHGNSDGAATQSYRVERLAADLADVLTALEVTGPLTLVGHSMGGMTALAYCGLPGRPVDPQGLVLIATAAGRLAERGLGRLLATPATEMLSAFVGQLPRRTTDAVTRAVLRPVCEAVTNIVGGDPHQSGVAAIARSGRAASAATAMGFLEGLKHYDVYDTLASITATTVIVSGGKDVTTPASHAHDMAAVIPGAVHLHRPQAGHMLAQEIPHTVSVAINRAMGRSPRSTRRERPRRGYPAPQLVLVNGATTAQA